MVVMDTAERLVQLREPEQSWAVLVSGPAPSEAVRKFCEQTVSDNPDLDVVELPRYWYLGPRVEVVADIGLQYASASQWPADHTSAHMHRVESP